MPRGRPVDDETRARAVELMHEGWGRNRIARELGVSGAVVTGIADAAGHVFDWRQTEVATAAAKIENAELRERLAKVALLQALEAIDRIHSPHEVVHFQPTTEHQTGGWKRLTLDEPTPSDQRNYATIFGIMVSKAAELSKSNAAAGDAGTLSFVETLAASLQAAVDSTRAGDETDPTVEPTNVSKDSLLAEYADAEDGEADE